MGFFDFLKKKQSNNTATANELETLLQQAASDPSVRETFYKKLLSGELYILSADKTSAPGRHTLDKDTQVSIVTFQDGKIPLFTSTNRIFDKGVIKDQVNYMAVKGEDLFGFTRGATFLLNPYSDYGKELLPDEIEALLSGQLFHSLSREITIEKETKVLIGQPAVYPHEMVAALTRLLETEPAVNAAYLGFIQYPDTSEPPHYVFCIDAATDLKRITNAAGQLTQQYLKSGEFVDFLSKDSLGGYFDTVAPFYKK